jgi:hypothetical protein
MFDWRGAPLRSIIGMGLLLALAPCAFGQQKEERRFGLIYNPELYPQETPQAALVSLLRAIDKGRYDYAVAFLLEKNYVREQMRITAAKFEEAARKQVEREGLDAKRVGEEFVRDRIQELADQANFDDLVQRVKTKFVNDPEALKELRQLAREGELADTGETATLKHPEIKDRALFFRNLNGRWYAENKMQE